MIPYFLILFFLFFCSILVRQSKNDLVKKTAFVVLALFAGFRYKVGIDYLSYIEIFNEVEGVYVREPGRALMISTIKSIGGTAQLYILVMALITEFFAYKTLIKYEKPNFWFLTILFYCISLFYIASFNASREFMAISLCTWNLYNVNKSKIKYFSIVLVAGFGLHFSAFIFIPLYFFIRTSHNLITIFFVLFILILLDNTFVQYLEYTPYAKYEAALYNDDRENKVQFSQYLLASVSLGLIFAGKYFKNFKNNIILVNMNILCFYTLILVIIQDVSTFIMLYQRVNNYFVYSYLLIIPAVLSSLKKDRELLAKVIMVIFSIGYLVLTIVVKGEKHQLIPYDINLNLFNF